MFDLNAYLLGGYALLLSACLIWLLSVIKKDVSIVDSFWAVMFVVVFVVYFINVSEMGSRGLVAGVLLLAWATRLSGYITWRNWGEGEDRRYQDIRRKYSPHFWLKSLFIIFIFQGILAWIVSMPLIAIITGSTAITSLDHIAILVIGFGIIYESIADWQLHKFKSQPSNHGKVMDKGVWRFSRHPNYFGEFCVWWGFYLMAVASGGWWSIISPLVMSFLLMRFSGVALLESDIVTRRPKYAEYIRSTNAFFPGLRRQAFTKGESI